MSKYENYSEVSKVYDKARTAMGADTIAGLLHVYGGKPLKDLHLLDAGSGTGNYAKALIELGVGKVTLLDASKDMLDVAKEKLKTEIESGIVDDVIEAKMPPLPFEDGKFDIVLFSMVLHHVTEDANGIDFPEMEHTFQETKRVLRPGGMMIITGVTPIMIRKSCWYCQLGWKNEALLDRFCKRFPTMEIYLKMLAAHNFNCVTKINILSAGMHKLYLDHEGPLKKEWRNSISFFSFATQEEIRDIEQFTRVLIQNGEIEQFIEEHDKQYEIGSSFLLACISV